jgi:hypothetical protein
VLESVLRNCDGLKVQEANVRELANWKANESRTAEIPFVVARIVLQDFTGVPLLVDLAAMRAAAARLGKDAGRIEPIVPVDLVVDHSVQVDAWGTPAALQANMALEFERAAELRDQIALLRRVQDQQSMDGGTGDVDVVAVMLTPGGACVHLISVRGGRVLGSKNFFPQVAIEEEGGDVLMAFLAQYYLGNAERDLPSELIVNVQHEDFATLIEAIESLGSCRAERIRKVTIAL